MGVQFDAQRLSCSVDAGEQALEGRCLDFLHPAVALGLEPATNQGRGELFADRIGAVQAQVGLCEGRRRQAGEKDEKACKKNGTGHVRWFMEIRTDSIVWPDPVNSPCQLHETCRLAAVLLKD